MDLASFKSISDECQLFADLHISDVSSEIFNAEDDVRLLNESVEASEKWKHSMADDQVLINLKLELNTKMKNDEVEDCKLRELEEAKKNLNDELNKAKTELSKILKKRNVVDTKCMSLRLDTETSANDAEVINGLKKRYAIFKSLTGIRWDYTSPENVAKGYIENKSTRYIHPFECSGKDTSATLWKLIGDASHSNWSSVNSVVNKENAIPNGIKN